MKLSPTHRRQMIDALKVKSGSKDYKITLLQSFKIEYIEEIINPLRHSYNHLISKMFEDYGVFTDYLYDEFDKAWLEAYDYKLLEGTEGGDLIFIKTVRILVRVQAGIFGRQDFIQKKDLLKQALDIGAKA